MRESIDELKWFIEVTSKAIEKTYDRKTVSFEHGMCACVGGLDRAHLHIIPISKKISSKDIKNAINKTLIKRKVGIESITFKGTKLQNQYDINKIMEIDPFIFRLSIFILSIFIGYYVVWSVTPSLHTPLMSVTNAISSVKTIAIDILLL